MFSLFKVVTFLALLSTFTLVSALSGRATYYYPGGGHGACGAPNQNWEYLVALPESEYNGGSHCYKHVTVQFKGKQVDATVVDLCPGCGDKNIDISPPVFSALNDNSLDAGVLNVEWWYN